VTLPEWKNCFRISCSKPENCCLRSTTSWSNWKSARTTKTCSTTSFRGFHTIKGGAGFLTVDNLVTLCHKTENLFDKLRNAELHLSPELMDTILAATGTVRDMFGHLAQSVQPGPADQELAGSPGARPERPSADASRSPEARRGDGPRSAPPVVAVVAPVGRAGHRRHQLGCTARGADRFGLRPLSASVPRRPPPAPAETPEPPASQHAAVGQLAVAGEWPGSAASRHTDDPRQSER
jgi:chemotaxis protein histidine kinase CheA